MLFMCYMFLGDRCENYLVGILKQHSSIPVFHIPGSKNLPINNFDVSLSELFNLVDSKLCLFSNLDCNVKVTLAFLIGGAVCKEFGKLRLATFLMRKHIQVLEKKKRAGFISQGRHQVFLTHVIQVA